MTIPKPGHPIVDGKPIDRYWYEALRRISDSAISTSDVQGIVNQAISGISGTQTRVYGSSTILATGDQSAGYGIALRALNDSGVGNGLWKFTRDDFGRVSGTQSATTDDLAEGATNLYHTAERAQDAVGAAITAGTGDGVTLAYDDAGNKINATNTDKGSVAVASHVAASDPHPQYLTQAEGDARYALAGSGGGGAGEILVQDGSSAPPVMLTNETESDFLYAG